MIIQTTMTITLFVFCLVVVYGALCDIRTYTIPNRVSYGLLGLFVLFAIQVWLHPKEIYFPELHKDNFHIPPIAFNIFYGLVVFAFFLYFRTLGWVGGGDVKFITAISFFMGLDDVLAFVVLMSVITILMVFILKAIPVINARLGNFPLPAFLEKMIAKIHERQIPYRVPAAMAALAVIPDVMAGSIDP